MVKYEYKYVSLEDAKKMESSEWRLVQVVGETLIFERAIGDIPTMVAGSNYDSPTIVKMPTPPIINS